jgi:aspartyl/asparaginyl-tRNA synthetase
MKIKTLQDHHGKRVKVFGWVQRIRRQGKREDNGIITN